MTAGQTYPDVFDYEQHLDFVISQVHRIEQGKITILTGPNGYGKSLLRKLLSQEKSPIKVPVASTSMQRRTSSNHDFSALKSMAIDAPDDATSNHTCYLIEQLLKQPDRYIVIDEPEIGLGPEVLLGLLAELDVWVKAEKAADRFKGLLIITHSPFVVSNVEYDCFINLQGFETFSAWSDRQISPISPAKLKAWCNKLSNTIEGRLSNKRSDTRN